MSEPMKMPCALAQGFDLPEGSPRLSGLLRPDAVKMDMRAGSKEEAFEELVGLLTQTGGVLDREGVLQALRRREATACTGICNGLAIPHAKHESIRKLAAAVGISRTGIDFGSADRRPARIIFLLLARTDNPGPHIQALSAIAVLAQSPDFVRRLMSAASPAEVVSIFQSEE